MGAISAMLHVLEMMRWRYIVEGRPDENSQDPLKKSVAQELAWTQEPGAISAMLCILGMISDA